MSRTYDFLKECGVFYVLTVTDNGPAGRPFGAVMEYDGRLYFSTATMKDVYRQLTANPKIQLIALKAGTRDWIRINGMAVECTDLSVKDRMLQECPDLTKHFDSPACEQFALFEVSGKEAYLNTNGVFIQID